MIDALTANITNLRSNLCFRLEDGTFAGFEGIRDYIGCGYGSVPHVWNYAQTVAFLFPDLEKTMRNVEFLRETDETGCMSTRMFSVFDQERYAMFRPVMENLEVLFVSTGISRILGMWNF